MAGFRDNNRPLMDDKLAELIDRKATYYQQAIRDHVVIFPGVKTLVYELAPKVPLGLASGALRREITTILTTAGLLNYFQAVVSGEDVKQGKPEPEIFLQVLVKLNAGASPKIEPGDCVVIEYSKEGIRGARRAGMKCLAVTNSHPLELLGDADAIVKSLENVGLESLAALCA